MSEEKCFFPNWKTRSIILTLLLLLFINILVYATGYQQSINVTVGLNETLTVDKQGQGNTCTVGLNETLTVDKQGQYSRCNVYLGRILLVYVGDVVKYSSSSQPTAPPPPPSPGLGTGYAYLLMGASYWVESYSNESLVLKFKNCNGKLLRICVLNHVVNDTRLVDSSLYTVVYSNVTSWSDSVVIDAWADEAYLGRQVAYRGVSGMLGWFTGYVNVNPVLSMFIAGLCLMIPLLFTARNWIIAGFTLLAMLGVARMLELIPLVDPVYYGLWVIFLIAVLSERRRGVGG